MGAAATLILAAAAVHPGPARTAEREYLPSASAAAVVSVSGDPNTAAAGVTVLTEVVAVKETGPRKTLARFGEVYAFAPSVFAVHRDEPTEIEFWNLQPDDEHDFMLVDPELNVLMKVMLAPLKKTSYVFTFHREGLFTFYCTMHQPEMNGQIIVLPPVAR